MGAAQAAAALATSFGAGAVDVYKTKMSTELAKQQLSNIKTALDKV